MCPSEIGAILLIIIIGVAVSIMIKRQSASVEGFANQAQATQKKQENFPNITFCPFNSTAVITNSGETLCCQGESSRKLGCLQKTVCSLSNSIGKNYGPCSKVYGEYIRNMSRICPRILPTYFEKRDPSNNDIVSEKGCYAGPTHPNKYEPVSAEQKKCIDYNSQKDSNIKINSCLNQKYLDNWINNSKLKIYKNPKVNLVKFHDNAPPLLEISSMTQQKAFKGAVEMPEITYTWASLVRYWKYTWPDYLKYNFDVLPAEGLKFIFEVNYSLRTNKIRPTDKKLLTTLLKSQEYF